MNGRKKSIIVMCCIVLAILIGLLFRGGDQDFHAKYEGADLESDIYGIGRRNTYDHYLNANAGVLPGEKEIHIDLSTFAGDGTMVENGLLTHESGTVSFSINAEAEGMYFVRLDYLPVNSRGVDMERALYINGSIPFVGADTLRFSRAWMDGCEVRLDNQGNEIRPTQVERFVSQQAYCRDDMGYVNTPYQFFFPAGTSSLSLEALNEPMIIQAITLVPVAPYETYAQYAQQQPNVEMSDKGKTWFFKAQGEHAQTRSTPSLYPRYDRSSPATEPYSVTNTILNYIGGDAWNMAGQWIEWTIEVPEDGYYNISLKARQSYQRGSISCRMLYLDGIVPFEEATNIAFDYNTAWELYTLSDENGTPFRFYMTKGEHTIRLEATLGRMGTILKNIEASIFRLNQIYRRILVLTGVNPDQFRDYNIAGTYPDVIPAMDLESKRLYKLVDDTVEITGQKNDRIAVAQTLAVQLEQFVNDSSRITQSFNNFKDNITSLGAAMQSMSECKLDIDFILVTGEDAKLPKVRTSFIDLVSHEIRSFIASYFVDYNSLGNIYEADGQQSSEILEVWIVTGRDQSTILKTMIDDSFTPEFGIPVNLKLVSADSLLTAVVAGNGPDVVLSVGNGLPVNYAMRNAAENLRQFDDYEEVIKDFYPSAVIPLQYNGGVYGLPETQDFSLLFYRSDVMEEIGLSIPQSWQELLDMLPTIQGNNMSVGIPFPVIAAADTSVLNSMIYQQGGQIYDEDGKRTLIDSENGVSAFETYTSLYNDYSLPTDFDFISRFRSGEMPLGLASYTTYNRLIVSAPEIQGLWNFTLFPGTPKTLDDGTTMLDRSVQSGGACCMMIATDNQQIRDNAWTFMKWWVSKDSQVRFGREIESVLGASARYSTANTSALEELSWSSKQLKVLKEQMAWTVGFPEIAGGYSTTRHMTNAIRKVINDKKDPRETLITYARTINEEIKLKRQEFDLPID